MSRSGPGDNAGALFGSLIARRVPVHLRCSDGYEPGRAIIRDADRYAILIETPAGLELLYQHAVISIVPAAQEDIAAALRLPGGSAAATP